MPNQLQIMLIAQIKAKKNYLTKARFFFCLCIIVFLAEQDKKQVLAHILYHWINKEKDCKL